MSETLRGSLSAFPLDMLVALLAEAGSTGRLELRSGSDTGSLDFTDGAATAAAHASASGESALAALVALDGGEFEFTPGQATDPNLSIRVQELRTRIRAARQQQRPRPNAPGPATLRLRALQHVLPRVAPEVQTEASVRVLGPQHAGPPAIPDPLWSPGHLAALFNALLFLFLGADRKRVSEEIEALSARARMKVPGIGGPLPRSKDGLDVPALGTPGFAAPWVVALVHEMIRDFFEQADAAHDGSQAERAYLAAVGHTIGPGEALAREALRIVGAGTRLRARLSVTRGEAAGPFPLEDRPYTIGRSAANDVRLEHPSVSRRHARLTPRSGRFALADAGSTAGTLVNGQLLDGERVLRGGESISLGDIVLTFEHVEV